MTGLTGTTALVRLILRRDRIRLPVWLVAILALVYTSALAVVRLYDDPVSIATYGASVGASAASVAMNGPATALSTIGGIAVFEVTLTAILGVVLLTIFTTVRHTRADEEAGRLEMLGATVLGRQAPIAAAALVATVTCLLVGAGITTSFLASGLPVHGSALYGASVACLGLVFTGIALVAAQLAGHGRAATGMSVGAFLVLFLVRAVGDVADSWVSFLSPVGWTQHVSAFGENDWRPLGLSIVATGALFVVAGWLATRRDLGAGVIQPRLGPARATASLGTPFGLALRMQRGVLLGWIAGSALLGAAYGSLINEVEEMLQNSPEADLIMKMLGGGDKIVNLYLGAMISMSALIVTGFTIHSVLRMRSDEEQMFLEQLLSTRLTRLRWALHSLAVTALGTLLLLLSFGVAMALSATLVSGKDVDLGQLIVAALLYLPATLTLGAFAFAVYGWRPRAAMLSWALLAVVFVVGWMGALLELPQRVIDTSPYNLTPQLPAEEFALTPLLGLIATVVGLISLGLVGLRRRDIETA
jgi:ABC-2 type transport system permease protein